MKITKKLRDLTKEEFEKWVRRNCGKLNCKDCLFVSVNCGIHDGKNWVNNKEVFSDKFLDQTIEIEVPDVLGEKKHKYHVYYVMKGDMYVFANCEEEAGEIVNHKKFDDLAEHLDSDCDITNTFQVEEDEENEY